MMREIADIINEIIPQADYSHRNGFNNQPIIDQLDNSERLLLEDELINMIQNNDDLLIAESLAYIKSIKSLNVLKLKLDSVTKPMERIILASCIFKINPSESTMIDIAYDSFIKITDKYVLIGMFYYLAGFNDTRINQRIKSYYKHNDFLLAYNSKRAMGIDVEIKKIKTGHNKRASRNCGGSWLGKLIRLLNMKTTGKHKVK